VFTPTETPAGKRYRIEGQATLDAMFSVAGVPNGIRYVTDRPGGRLRLAKSLPDSPRRMSVIGAGALWAGLIFPAC
jgi:hypothetical protein